MASVLIKKNARGPKPTTSLIEIFWLVSHPSKTTDDSSVYSSVKPKVKDLFTSEYLGKKWMRWAYKSCMEYINGLTMWVCAKGRRKNRRNLLHSTAVTVTLHLQQTTHACWVWLEISHQAEEYTQKDLMWRGTTMAVGNRDRDENPTRLVVYMYWWKTDFLYCSSLFPVSAGLLSQRSIGSLFSRFTYARIVFTKNWTRHTIAHTNRMVLSKWRQVKTNPTKS